jgi:outer membrane immunogenic protein
MRTLREDAMSKRPLHLASAALFALALAVPAGAADLGRMPTKAPVAVPPPPFSWSGCYIGGFVGGAFTNDDAGFTDLGNGIFPSFSGGIVPAGLGGPGIHSFAVPLDSSVIGGGTLGCNWQFAGSPFVIGIEGEGGYMKLDGAAFDPFVNATVLSPVPDVLGAARVGDWYAMVTGRLGYAMDRVLFYVKGGAAFVPVKASVIDNCFAGGCGNWQIATFIDDTATVGTFGGGVEWAFAPNWSIKAEYMFIGLGNNGQTSCGTATILGTGVAVPGGAFCFNHDFPDIHTVKVGVNWRFGSIFGFGP